jgi:homogentisate 1,2-dioxygenase
LLPQKPHTALTQPDGALYYEHCLTRDGFNGPFTISYHATRPQAFELGTTDRVWAAPVAAPNNALRRRHLLGPPDVPKGDSLAARVPLLWNDDVVIGWRAPSATDTTYFQNADGDELVFVQQGKGTLHSAFGPLAFGPGSYLYVPKGVAHRFEIEGAQGWLSLEFRNGLGIPAAYRNGVGQLTMAAPYSQRDFELPEFEGIIDEGIREVLVKRDDALSQLSYASTPFDMVGFDGSVYPFRFPILAFQPRTGAVHLPPTTHLTFEAGGALVCSFVPRLLDFGAGAIPSPYPHSSVDVDEVLFYSSGEFTSRSGVRAGSFTLHPRGTAHGPQPGRYEASIGAVRTGEVAVMLDCTRPLRVTEAALSIDDAGYDAGFR